MADSVFSTDNPGSFLVWTTLVDVRQYYLINLDRLTQSLLDKTIHWDFLSKTLIIVNDVGKG